MGTPPPSTSVTRRGSVYPAGRRQGAGRSTRQTADQGSGESAHDCATGRAGIQEPMRAYAGKAISDGCQYWMVRVDIGRSEWIRTTGPCVPNTVLYQAELHSDRRT